MRKAGTPDAQSVCVESMDKGKSDNRTAGNRMTGNRIAEETPCYPLRSSRMVQLSIRPRRPRAQGIRRSTSRHAFAPTHSGAYDFRTIVSFAVDLKPDFPFYLLLSIYHIHR